MVSIATSTCCTGPFIPRISSVSTEQSQSGAEQILKRQVKADSKVLAKHHQKIKLNKRISSHWLIFQDYRMLRETECFRVWKISIRCHLWAKLNISVQRRNSTIRSRKEIIMLQPLLKMTDEENARQCAKNTQRPETGRIQGHTHPLMQIKKLVQSWDCYGYWCSWYWRCSWYWSASTITEFSRILRVILTSRDHERFVNEIHRHNSDIVNYSSSSRTTEENLNRVFANLPNVVNHVQGSQDSNNVETKVESSSVHQPRPLRKAAAAAAAILRQYIRKRSPFT